ncbi:MAG: leucyl aminopeptidase [Pseudomonadota bacterium]
MHIGFETSADSEIHAVIVDEGAKLPEEAIQLDEASGGLIAEALSAERFTGKLGQQAMVVMPKSAPARRVVLVGGGKRADRTPDTLERLGAELVKSQGMSGFSSLSFLVSAPVDAAHAAAGAELAAYRFDTYFTKLKPAQKPSLERFALVTSDVDAAEAAFIPLAAEAAGTCLARDLMNEPPNILYPEAFAARAKALEAEGVEVTVLGEEEMSKLGMGSLLGVGQGSVRDSQLAVMRWSGGGAEAPVCLVGKGVCFDSGGISLKPGPGMEDMKGDMGGAAAVTGAMLALARRKAKANVVGLIGLVENMPGANAQRPGDIVTSASGQTIEIQNTDAEGRLVLADVLWYAQETFKPRAIVDLATLTGAIVISLGQEHAGLFSNNDDLATALSKAGEASGEKVWRLPLGEAYDALLKSRFADMRNIGGRSAGSITAAQFLQRFVDKDTPWAHLDIAGVAWRDSAKPATDPSWPSGFGARLLSRWIADSYES